ncbi:hypothetical protein LXL04_033274 [Taraxacum kok-saghyz]
MLDSRFNARLGDFGLARWLEHEFKYQNVSPSVKHYQVKAADTTRIGGTIGYLSPESFQKGGLATAKSDVFSFGIVLLEIASGRKAVDLTLPEGSYKVPDMELLILALLCTLHDPGSRPNMKWVVDALSGNTCVKIPDLPSFKSHPRYISVSPITSTSITNTTTTITITTTTTTTTTTTVSSGSTASTTTKAELDFGTAYHGVINNSEIIIKRLGMKTCPALRGRFANELSNMGRLNHRNLVQLYGWCTEHGEMLIVYHCIANRLLGQLLSHHNHRRSQPVLQWGHRYTILKSLAGAVQYLDNEWEEQVIHRNITSSAIGVEPDMNPRLGSFALAEFLTRNEKDHHEATTMADVYSFGVVVLEVVTGQMAVDFRNADVLLVRRVHEFESQEKDYKQLVDPRLDGEYDHEELVRLVKLGVACTWSNPMLRPTMRQVVSILDGRDKCLMEVGQKENIEEWKERNALALSLVRRVQALGIQ